MTTLTTRNRPAQAARTIDFSYAPTAGWTLICRPDDPFKSLVREDGALLYGFRADSFDAWSFDTVLEFRAQTPHPPVLVEQVTETPRRPIVRTTVSYPDLTLELTSFATVEDGRRTDVVLWAITASPAAGEVLAGLHVDGYLREGTLAGTGEGPCHRVYPVPARPGPRTRAWMDNLPRVDGAPADPGLSVCSAPHPLLGVHAEGFRPASGLLTRPVVLHGGQSVSGVIAIALNHDEELPGDRWALERLEAERAFWDRLDLIPGGIEVPDPEVQDLLVACARNLIQAREPEDGLSALHVGPTIYRGIWIVDGYFMLEAARYLGLGETADAGISLILRRAKPSGAITAIDHEPVLKETAFAVAALVRQAELTGDHAALRASWPQVRAAVGYMDGLREQSRELPAEHPLHGLMPEAFADGGLGGTRAEYTTTLAMLLGLKFAAEGAWLLGEDDDRTRFTASFGELLAAFSSSAERHRQQVPGGAGHYLPMCLPGSGRHYFYAGVRDEDVPPWRLVEPQTAIWSLCHAIWPGEVFAADSIYVQDLLGLFDAVDDEEGIPWGMGFLTYHGIWSLASAFAAHVWLYAGRPDKATDYLYAFANHAYPTRAWREEQPLRGSGHWQISGDMPHNWASAEFIRLVRHLLVFEHGSELRLLPALPPEWVRDGAVLNLARTPTRFGDVTLALRVLPESISISVTRHPHQHQDPRRCVLTIPAGYHDVRIDGEPVQPGGDCLELFLPPGQVVTIEAAS